MRDFLTKGMIGYGKKKKYYKNFYKKEKIKRIPKKELEFINYLKKNEPFKDYDNDKVINKYDCNPINYYKQGQKEVEKKNYEDLINKYQEYVDKREELIQRRMRIWTDRDRWRLEHPDDILTNSTRWKEYSRRAEEEIEIIDGTINDMTKDLKNMRVSERVLKKKIELETEKEQENIEVVNLAEKNNISIRKAKKIIEDKKKGLKDHLKWKNLDKNIKDIKLF